jgi:predicted XRE-type DNA-binding protein
MDWAQTISELKLAGVTQMQIAAWCGVGQTTVSDLVTGKSRGPTYAFGASLLKLHKRHARRISVRQKLATR